MVTPALVVAVALLGALAGPWLNLAADRVPAGLRLVGRGPLCSACGVPRSLGPNLAGRSISLVRRVCRGCGTALPWRPAVLEVATVLAFVLAAIRLGWSGSLPAILILFAGLAALSACDVEHHLLPRRIVYPTAMAATLALLLAAAASDGWGRLGVAALCGVGVFGITFVIHAINPRWLGFGDVRLSGLIGLVLGWLGPSRAWAGLVVADVLGLVVMGLMIGLGRARRDTPFPFGVFLAAGAVAAVLI